MNTDKQHPTLTTQDESSEKIHAKKPKTAKRNRGRGSAADVMETIGSWAAGAFVLAIAAAFLFGPAFISELREDEIMSVLDLSDEQLADTAMGDLIDIRRYVDEYETDEEINKRAAEKVGKILDSAIEQRLGK